MKSKLFAVVFLLSLTVLASFAQAESLDAVPLTQGEAEVYLGGNAFESSQKNGQSVRTEFKKNGDVVAVNKSGRRISKGKWSVDELGQVCQVYSKSARCALLYRGGFFLWTEGKSSLKFVK
jgi:opacity protein-like surface antigen